MFQNTVNFYGEYFMTYSQLCARQIESDGNWWVVKMKEQCWPFGYIVHYTASSVREFPVAAHIC